MFSAVIQLNCSSMNQSDLFVSVDQHEETSCSIDQMTDQTFFNITCLPIDDSAGRDILLDLFLGDERILLGRFDLTLPPLVLNQSATIEIKYTGDPQEILVHVNNCQTIAPEKYLRLRCSYVLPTESILTNCSSRCLNLLPGSNSALSLIRQSIPWIDEPMQFFPSDIIHHIYQTSNKSLVRIRFGEKSSLFSSWLDLSSVSNLSFRDDDGSVRISYQRPLGYFDLLFFNCFARDQICSNQSRILTRSIASSFNSTEISLSPIVRGVNYSCQVTTTRIQFVNATSKEYFFQTS